MSQNAVLNRLLEQRAEQEQFIDNLLAQVEEAGRDLVEAERQNLESIRQRITQLDDQIRPLEAWEETRNAHRANRPSPTPAPRNDGQSRERLTIAPREVEYPSPGHFVVDLIKARGYPGMQVRPDTDAAQRVAAATGHQVRAAGDVADSPAHFTTADAPGVMPEVIVGQIHTDLDGARPFVNSLGVKELSAIPGQVFHRPKVTQHTTTGPQEEEKAELPSRELKIEGVAFEKETYGGTLNVSRQAIDWTSPSAWNAVITDLQLVYGTDTEDAAAAAFAATVSQSEAVDDEEDIASWIHALYMAAVKAATANGTKRASSLRLPNHIWTSIDMWAALGSVLTTQKVKAYNSAGQAAPNAFAGDILDIPRTMAPGLPTGTLIVGRRELFEFYEERIGLLSAVEPKVLGIEIAYGGYVAWGNLDATAFAKLTVNGS